ncbi:NAD(P)H-binding protein [Streptomyces sp. NPDC001296]
MPGPGFDTRTYQIEPMKTIRPLQNGDTIGLRDRALSVCHLPGHTAACIALPEHRTGVPYAGDVIYDGRLIVSLPDSALRTHRPSMQRLARLDVSVVRPGHGHNFGPERLRQLTRAQVTGAAGVTPAPQAERAGWPQAPRPAPSHLRRLIRLHLGTIAQQDRGTRMKLVIFGANGKTGRLLTRQALEAGHRVTAVTRHPDVFPLAHEHLDVVPADVYLEDDVVKAVRGANVVLSALGVPFSRDPISVYSTGVANIVTAMRLHGVTRIVAVSSSALDPRPHAEGGVVLNRVVQPLITRTIGRTTYADMTAMETLLADSDLDWTVMRPSGLFDAEKVSDYRLQEDHADGVFTSRADLAACLLAQAGDGRWSSRRVAVTTPEGAPTLWQLIRREAFGKSPE